MKILRSLMCLSLITVCLAVTDAKADVIFGTIRFAENKRPAAGLSVIVRCRGPQTYAARIQDGGDYKVFVQEEGACMLQVMIGPPDKAPRAAVSSYDEPVRYDFAIVGGPDGYGLSRQ